MIKELFSINSRDGLFSSDQNVHGFAVEYMDKDLIFVMELLKTAIDW